MPSGIVGGDILSGVGGQVIVWAFDQDSNAEGLRLDVAEWKVRELLQNAECTTSGCYGALNFRRVAVGYKFWARIPFDLTQPGPKYLLKSCNTIQLRFNFGNPIEGQYPPGYDSAEFWQYYYSPAALLDEVTTVSNASKDVIWQEVFGTGTSHIFLLGGAEESGNAESAEAQIYEDYLASRGWRS